MITINICGHDSRHLAPFEIRNPKGYEDYLLLLVKTDAWFLAEGIRIQTRPGMAILFAPGTSIRYGRDTKNYSDDWVHFSLPPKEARELFANLTLPLGKPFYPSDFPHLSEYMRLLTQEFHSPGPHSTVICDALLRALLLALDQELNKQDDRNAFVPYHAELAHLRTRIYSNPERPWQADAIASELGISTSHFQHLYKSFFGHPCREDIIGARLQSAKLYLSRSNMTVHRIAELCGYENELPFMRQFKKREGMTPSQFRESSLRKEKDPHKP